jgi:hypothetical protein
MEENIAYIAYAAVVVLILVALYVHGRVTKNMANTWTVDGEGELESVEERETQSIDEANASIFVGYYALIPRRTIQTHLTFRDGSHLVADGSFSSLPIGTKIRVSHNDLYRYRIETLS